VKVDLSGVKRCAGTLYVVGPSGKVTASRNHVLGKARFRIRAGHRRVVRVRLSRRALASSKHRYILRVRMRGAGHSRSARPVRIGKRVRLVFASRRTG
jgi:hypothetical protein